MRYRGQAYLLSHLIAEAAERDAGRTALKCRADSINYGDLYERSNGLAHALRQAGIRKGDRVGILMNKSVQLGPAIYGIMSAGAAYVPLDPTAPVSRLAFMIRDCGIRILVSEPRKLPVLAELSDAGSDIDVVFGIDEDGPYETRSWSEVDPAPSPPSTDVTEQDLSYILYTSGSTGVPKGIMHTHRSALSWANVSSATYSITSSDVISNYAPLHFDLSTLDYFGGARAGATTVMIPEEHMKLPASLAGLLESERLSLFYTVPMALTQLSTPGVLDNRDLSSLQRVLFGGEPMPLKHLRTLMQRLPHTRFFNVYGPTEVNGCTHHEVVRVPEIDDPPLPIGRPYDNVEALVLQPDGSTAEQGEVGELAIRTPTMMRGYWGRPDLNERAFHFRNDLEGLPEIFHKTGDLVHRDRDGALHFHGRRDRQIKSRGNRVELDEVEATLLTHPHVREAAVYAVFSDSSGATIHASVILRDGQTAEPSDLRSFLADSLPGYAIPQTMVIRDDFPRTTSGKIDRRELAHAMETS